MNKYAVVLLADEEEPGTVVSILRTVDASVYEHYAARGIYFARFAGTAQQLAERLGFANDYGAKRGIVIGAGGQYYGYANRDLWNWMGGT